MMEIKTALNARDLLLVEESNGAVKPVKRIRRIVWVTKPQRFPPQATKSVVEPTADAKPNRAQHNITAA